MFLSCRHLFFAKKHCFQWRCLSCMTSLETLSPECDQSLATIRSVYLNPCFSLLSICRNIKSLRRAHSVLITHGLTGDVLLDTKLVSLYGALEDLKSARLVFDQIWDPDLYSWKVMIRSYFLRDEHAEVLRFYDLMRIFCEESDNVVFSVVLKACSELKDLDAGRKLQSRIVKVGNPDSFVLTGLVDMYAKCGEIECSRRVFDDVPDRNVISWTSMIVGYIQNDYPEEGLVLFNQMRESLVPGNQFTLGSLVGACTKLRALHQGKWLHGYVIKAGIELNSYLVTDLLDMYAKCGCISDARLVFDELSSTDLVSWTAMIVGYNQSGLPHEAMSLFVDKRWVGIVPNSITIASVISACSQSGNSKLGRSVHGLAVQLGLEDLAVINALLNMYARCGLNRDALYLFEIDSNRDVIAWDSIISGLFQSGSARDALAMFYRMRSDAVMPDAVTIVSVISACASVGDIVVGSSLHAYSVKEGFLWSNVYVGTALLSLYAKCGDAWSARMVFDSMAQKNTITWSAMIGGYGKQGDGAQSLALFDDMLNKKLRPNELVFTSVLSACSHTGLVTEGKRHFNSMYMDYKFMPSTKHYACMVDMLARAGKLEEAWDFMCTMPVVPDVSCFGAFLHGCGMYLRFDLGELGIRRMMELHPDKACYYVLMANLYASDGRWGHVKEMRELMKQRGLNKPPGLSLVEADIENKVLDLRMASYAYCLRNPTFGRNLRFLMPDAHGTDWHSERISDL